MWHRHPACNALGGVTYSFSIRLPAPCTNNLAEYEVVHRGMELLIEAGAEAVEVFGDSKLVISQCNTHFFFKNKILCK
jgi:ribonuclease HI